MNRCIIGDCREILPTLPENSVDAVVCDPPYGLSFMGKDWDHGIPGVHFWQEAIRIMKPGAHLLAFGGTRTFHRLTCAIEDAGFEIRDCLMWLYGSGFPKSLDVSKAIDKGAGHWRGCAGQPVLADTMRSMGQHYERTPKGDPVTAAAAAWSGFGTALKPAWEPIILARKPLDGTVAENVQQYGCGALNIDKCRVGYSGPEDKAAAAAAEKRSSMADRNFDGWGMKPQELTGEDYMNGSAGLGRWPANVIHDGSEEVLAAFPDAPGQLADASNSSNRKTQNAYGAMKRGNGAAAQLARLDIGSAARFFYCAKASKKDREEGCEHLPPKQYCHDGGQTPIDNAYQRNSNINSNINSNHHPTVKPTALMRYLCRLVTPPGGVVLDPFMGSGSTGKAAVLEGFDFIGIEQQAEYLAIAQARIAAAQIQVDLPKQMGMTI